LAPAKISKVFIDEESRHMEVIVADEQLSLAIGKRGQNVRLASKLTGWKIDIKSESKMEKISAEILESFKGLPYIGDVTSRVLYNEGFRSVKDIAEVDPEDLARVLEIDKEKALEITEKARAAQQKGSLWKGAVLRPFLRAGRISGPPRGWEKDSGCHVGRISDG
jgi:N utilization substance protein A